MPIETDLTPDAQEAGLRLRMAVIEVSEAAATALRKYAEERDRALDALLAMYRMWDRGSMSEQTAALHAAEAVLRAAGRLP